MVIVGLAEECRKKQSMWTAAESFAKYCGDVVLADSEDSNPLDDIEGEVCSTEMYKEWAKQLRAKQGQRRFFDNVETEAADVAWLAGYQQSGKWPQIIPMLRSSPDPRKEPLLKCREERRLKDLVFNMAYTALQEEKWVFSWGKVVITAMTSLMAPEAEWAELVEGFTGRVLLGRINFNANQAKYSFVEKKVGNKVLEKTGQCFSSEGIACRDTEVGIYVLLFHEGAASQLKSHVLEAVSGMEKKLAFLTADMCGGYCR